MHSKPGRAKYFIRDTPQGIEEKNMPAQIVSFADVEKTYKRPRLLGAVYNTALRGPFF